VVSASNVGLGIQLAIIGATFFYLYAAFKMDERHSVVSTFLFLCGLMFVPFSGLVARYLARENNWTDIAQVLDMVFLGQFMIFFFLLLYFGIVVHSSDAIQLGVGNTEEFDFNKDG